MELEAFESMLEEMEDAKLVTFVIRRQHLFSPEQKKVVGEIVTKRLPPEKWKDIVETLRRSDVDLRPIAAKPRAETESSTSQKKSTYQQYFFLILLIISVVVAIWALKNNAE